MKTPIYLDYMASTPIDARVVEQMTACLTAPELIGNPSSSMHVYGRYASAKIEHAREQVAQLLHCVAKQIIFTSGGTEAINLAIKGAAQYYQRQGQHIITVQTEHKAVLNTCTYLESQGFSVTYLPVMDNGLVDMQALQAAIQPDTILVSVMHVNNETGVIQDVAAIGALLRKKGIIFHVDGVQSVGKLSLDIPSLPIDLLSFSAHKMYGPKGIGGLYVSHQPKINIMPLIHGGDQEGSLRSGTLPVHQIIGLGAACEIALAQLDQDYEDAQQLNTFFAEGLSAIADMHIQGDGAARVPTCFNVRFEGVDARDLLLQLHEVLAASPGSACTSAHVGAPSHVLTAMGLSAEQAQQALRLSFGRFTTQEALAKALTAITTAVQTLRSTAS